MGLRIGLIHYTTPPVVGGVESVLAHHARLLADAGHAVRVITGRGGGADPRAEVVRIPLADSRHPAILAIRTALDAGDVPAAFGSVTDELTDRLGPAVADLDVVIAHNVCALHFDLPLTAALHRLFLHPRVDARPARKPGSARTRPRLVAWQHDLAATTPRYADAIHPGPPWDLLRNAWPGVTYVTISEARRREQAGLFGIPETMVRVVPNGIDVDGFLGLHPATRRTIAGLGLAPAWPVLLVPVRITPRKNLELAVGVVAALRRDGDDARLVVTGPPDPHDATARDYVDAIRGIAARAGIGRAVHLLGADRGRRLPPTVVSDLYRVVDLLFLPSRDEGFGLPILEAAACRLPIVCADIAPFRELAGNGADYVDPDADPAEVAAVVRQRLAEGRTAGLAARVRTTYGWEAIAATRIEPLLAEVMAGTTA